MPRPVAGKSPFTQSEPSATSSTTSSQPLPADTTWVKAKPPRAVESVASLEAKATEVYETLPKDQQELSTPADAAALQAAWKQAFHEMKGPGNSAAIDAALKGSSITLASLASLLAVDSRTPQQYSPSELLPRLALGALQQAHPDAQLQLLAQKPDAPSIIPGMSKTSRPLIVCVTIPDQPPLFYTLNTNASTSRAARQTLAATILKDKKLNAEFQATFAKIKGSLKNVDDARGLLQRAASTTGGDELFQVIAAMEGDARQQVLSAWAESSKDKLKSPLGELLNPIDDVKPNDVLIEASADHIVGGFKPQSVSSLVNIGAVDGLGKQHAFEVANYEVLTAPVFARYRQAAQTPVAVDGDQLANALTSGLGITPEQAKKAAEVMTGGQPTKIAMAALPVIFDSKETGTQMIPLIRAQRADGAQFLVDFTGGEPRRYTDLEDWRKHNRLPAGHISYLKPLGGLGRETEVQQREPTHASSEMGHGADKAIGVVGAAVGLTAMFGPAGLIPWWVSLPTLLGSSAWFGTKSASALTDRWTHGQTLSPLNPAARAEWLGLGANATLLGAGTLGPVARLMAMEAMPGAKTTAGAAAAMGVTGDVLWAGSLADATHTASMNWSALSTEDRALIVGSDLFWAAATRSNSKAVGGLRSMLSVKQARDRLLAGTPVFDGLNRETLNFHREKNPQALAKAAGQENAFDLAGRFDLEAHQEAAAVSDPSKVGQSGKYKPLIASNDGLFATLFGRDSLRAAIDMMIRALSLGRFSEYMAQKLAPYLSGAVNVMGATLIEHAKIQGRHTNAASDQRFGATAHENRAPGDPLIPHLPKGWHEKPGISGVTEPLINYGTVDATPNYIRGFAAMRNAMTKEEFAEYLRIETTNIIDGKKVTMAESLVMAYGWLRARIDDPAGGGYVWSLRQGPDGIQIPSWRDSGDGLHFANGKLFFKSKNATSPAEETLHMATEVQGYAYNALQDFARLSKEFGLHEQSSLLSRTEKELNLSRDKFSPAEIEARAAQFKEHFHKDFWVDHSTAKAYLEENHKAVEAVRAEYQRAKQVGNKELEKTTREWLDVNRDMIEVMSRRYKAIYNKKPTLDELAETLTGYGGVAVMKDGKVSAEPLVSSNIGHLLGSRIMDGKSDRIQGIVDRMVAPDMIAEEGILTLSRMAMRYKPGAYHQGSVWSWDTGYIARAMRERGFEEQGRMLENKVLELVAREGSFVELSIGLKPGTFAKWDADAKHTPRRATAQSTKDVVDPQMGTNRVRQPPQRDQAWTITLVWRILMERGYLRPPPPPGSGIKPWQIWADEATVAVDKLLKQRVAIVPNLGQVVEDQKSKPAVAPVKVE